MKLSGHLAYRIAVSALVALILEFFALGLARLQLRGDLIIYMKVYEMAAASTSFFDFYLQSNAFANVPDPLYSFLVYLLSFIIDFNYYIAISGFIFFFLLLLNLFQVKKLSLSFALVLLTISSLYPWALVTNVDKLKVAFIFFFLSALSRSYSNALWPQYTFLIASVLSHFSMVIPSALFLMYDCKSSENYHNEGEKPLPYSANANACLPYRYFSAQSLLNKLKSISSDFYRVHLVVSHRTLFVILLSASFSLLAAWFLPRIAYYINNNEFDYIDTVQSVYLAILFQFSLDCRRIAGFKTARNSTLNLPFGVLFSTCLLLISFTLLSLTLGMFRINILIFFCSILFVTCNGKFLGGSFWPFVLALSPLAVISFFRLMIYVQSSLYFGYGYETL